MLNGCGPGSRRSRVLSAIVSWRSAARTVLDPYLRGHGDALQQMLYADMFTWLSDNLLERGDRMSMAASLETRPPFLDYRLVELAYALPSRYKVRRGNDKMDTEAGGAETLARRGGQSTKDRIQGAPERLVQRGLRDYAYDCLTGPSSHVGARFSKSEIVKLLDAHLSGSRNEENRIWTLLSLEVWHRDMLAEDGSDRQVRPNRSRSSSAGNCPVTWKITVGRFRQRGRRNARRSGLAA